MDITIKEVSKYYDKQVLKDISLSIKGYQTIGIIGKSGCGKSTLLRLLTGIEDMENGEIQVDDYILDKKHMKAYQDKIAMVFQQHNLFPHLSLLENISLILEKRKGYSQLDANTKAMKILTQLHLEEQVHKKPRYVSGGQGQRASIARALSTDPDIIFMDEPTAALDPILTKEV